MSSCRCYISYINFPRLVLTRVETRRYRNTTKPTTGAAGCARVSISQRLGCRNLPLPSKSVSVAENSYLHYTHAFTYIYIYTYSKPPTSNAQYALNDEQTCTGWFWLVDFYTVFTGALHVWSIGVCIIVFCREIKLFCVFSNCLFFSATTSSPVSD